MCEGKKLLEKSEMMHFRDKIYTEHSTLENHLIENEKFFEKFFNVLTKPPLINY